MNSIKKIIFGLTIVLSFSYCNHRQKDPDELVEHDYIKEIGGIYYFCDCEEHCGDKKMNTRGENYYENGKVRNTWKLVNGEPDGLWTYYDSLGKKTMLITFNKGSTINKTKY